MPQRTFPTVEHRRMAEDRERIVRWRHWGPYVSERAWGTVREDYSAEGDAWSYFPHDHARSRAYRWSEDGMAGVCDRSQTLCLAIALWNEKDDILKERAFGVSGPEGNHGEDVKEVYYYEDATPTSSYLRYLYKYPQARYPYVELVAASLARDTHEREAELADLGAFDGDRYFDVTVEYAKRSPADILMAITAENRGPEAAPIHLLPQLWFRNTWAWSDRTDGLPEIKELPPGHAGPAPAHAGRSGAARAFERSMGELFFYVEGEGELLFTDNETNTERLWGTKPREAPG